MSGWNEIEHPKILDMKKEGILELPWDCEATDCLYCYEMNNQIIAIIRLSQILEDKGVIWIDEFDGFTPQEFEIIKNENEQLKQQLNLAEKYGEFTTVPGTIISRDISNYSKTLVINIGSDNGIKEKKRTKSNSTK